MDSHSTHTNTTKSPVLFLVFNRPDMTAEVFEAIRKAKPARLYVAGDGPRDGVHSDLRLVEETRRIATEVDWPCHVETLFMESNLGCKAAVSGAITWFFENELEGIILEDDCLPSPDFFFFCDELIERYRDDPKVMAITGNNFQNGITRGPASYYFSTYPHVWGWATWRRAWRLFDAGLSSWQDPKERIRTLSLLRTKREKKYWSNILSRVSQGRLPTSWAYPWTGSVFQRAGLTATPNVNLVTNIGFGADSTHTSDSSSPFANMPSGNLGQLVHPEVVQVDDEADIFTFNNVFQPHLFRNSRYVQTFLESLFTRKR